MQPLASTADRSSEGEISRLPRPTEVVLATDADADDWERFPRGLPHMIAIARRDGVHFSVRIRTHNGSMALLMDPTTDLAAARQSLSGFRLKLINALYHWDNMDPKDRIEIERGKAFELESGIDHRARIASGAYDPYEVVAEDQFDGSDLERFPHGYLFPLALSPGEDGGERYGIARNWLGWLGPLRVKEYDPDEDRLIGGDDEGIVFIDQFDDLAECKAQMLADMAECIYLWGHYLEPGGPEWEAIPERPAAALQGQLCR